MPTHVADRMTYEERLDIYRWAGQGHTLREMCRMYNNKHPAARRARIPTIERILAQPEAHRFIAKFRTEFLKTVKDIPVADKKTRLDDLERLRQRLMHIACNCHLERSKGEFSKFLAVTKRAMDVLDLARNEMEQRPGVAIGIGIGQGDMGELTDKQIQEQRDDIIRKASKSINIGAEAPDEIADGNEAAPRTGSVKVLLAPSEELQREELQERDIDIPNIRQQDDNDKGLPAV